MKTGRWVPYDESAKDDRVNRWLRHGKWCQFYDSGILKKVKDFNGGGKIEKEVIYNMGGKVAEIVIRKHDKLIAQHYFNRQGEYTFSEMGGPSWQKPPREILTGPEYKEQLSTVGYDDKNYKFT